MAVSPTWGPRTDVPTYDYVCRSCDHRFEEFQSITADPLGKCPECGKRKLERLIGAGAGFLFKGSGFYETDYRSETYKSDAARDSESSEKGAGEAEGAESSPKAGKKARPERDVGMAKQDGDRKGGSEPAKPSRSTRKRR